MDEIEPFDSERECQEAEERIASRQRHYVLDGIDLARLSKSRFYWGELHQTWDKYLAGTFDVTRQYADNLVRAVTVARICSPELAIVNDRFQLLTQFNIPRNEWQARLLAPLKDKDIEEAARHFTFAEATTAEIKEWLAAQEEPPSPITLPEGQFRTIVCDPPWPMVKIEREVRPNQGRALDYRTMSVEEIAALPVGESAAPGGCHLYLWATHRFLPDALKIMADWGFEYECLLTWVKNVGFTPYSFMYSTEHVLFGHLGKLPLLKFGERLDFAAKVREHSRKPDEFYDLVGRVSPEPRLEMFSRQEREGFTAHGDEVDKFALEA